jgi:hypothetical protein
MAARPHVLFRETASGANFGRLAMVSLDAPTGERRWTAVTCQRLSFAGGRGLCLHLQRGVFNSYTAQLLDRTLTPGQSIKLEGFPAGSASRLTAVGGDGVRVGDDYAAAFSTRTTLVVRGGDRSVSSRNSDVARRRALPRRDFNFGA